MRCALYKQGLKVYALKIEMKPEHQDFRKEILSHNKAAILYIMAEITISPATEADIAALAEIEFNALRLDLISHFLLKNPYDEESNRALIKWGIKQGFEPDNHLIKAVAQVPNGENGTTEKILGFCWYVKKLDGKIEPWKEAEERKKEAREKGSLENDLDGTNDEMLDRMMVPLRKHYMNALQGVPHMCK